MAGLGATLLTPRRSCLDELHLLSLGRIQLRCELRGDGLQLA